MAVEDLLRSGPAPLFPRVDALPGVATVFDTRSTISLDLDREVQRVLDGLDPGVTTAALNIHTQRGVNLMVASRIGERLTASLWVGKSGWDLPVREGWAGAVSLRGAWGGK